MIKCKEDLYYYLSEDRKWEGNGKPNWSAGIYKTEMYYLYKFKTVLRYYEYYLNCSSELGLMGKIKLLFYRMRFYQLMHKTQLYIYPNVCGPGLYLPHLGYILISAQAEIGCNCVIRPGTLIASNLGSSNTKLRRVKVGDNVEFSSGCKVICKKIGNNVSVGPNAVVGKNVPDNSIVMGNPGEIVPKITF